MRARSQHWVFGFYASSSLFYYMAWSAGLGGITLYQFGSAADLLRLFLHSCVFFFLFIARKRHSLKALIWFSALLIFSVYGGFRSENLFNSLFVAVDALTVYFLVLFWRELDYSEKASALVLIFISQTAMLILGGIFSGVSGGDFLFSLTMIQLPVIVTSTAFLVYFGSFDKKCKLALSIYFIQLSLGAYMATSQGDFRLQFTPLGYTGIFIVLLCLGRMFRYRLSGIIVFFLVISGGLFLFSSFVSSILDYRFGSLLERMEIARAMARESMYFLLPMGFGGSLIDFDISDGLNGLSTGRSVYPPHSGLAIIFFEISYFGFAIFVLSFWFGTFRGLKAPLIMPASKFGHRRVRFFLLALLGSWVFENLFYIKAIIGPDYLSNDFLLPMILFTISLVEGLRFRRKAKIISVG